MDLHKYAAAISTEYFRAHMRNRRWGPFPVVSGEIQIYTDIYHPLTIYNLTDSQCNAYSPNTGHPHNMFAFYFYNIFLWLCLSIWEFRVWHIYNKLLSSISSVKNVFKAKLIYSKKQIAIYCHQVVLFHDLSWQMRSAMGEMSSALGLCHRLNNNGGSIDYQYYTLSCSTITAIHC